MPSPISSESAPPCDRDQEIAPQFDSSLSTSTRHTLVVDLGGANVAQRFAASATSPSGKCDGPSRWLPAHCPSSIHDFDANPDREPVAFSRLVVFLPAAAEPLDPDFVEQCVALSVAGSENRVCLVATGRRPDQLGRPAIRNERLLRRFLAAGADATLLETAWVQDDDARPPDELRWLAPWRPLIPPALAGNVVSARQLWEAIDWLTAANERRDGRIGRRYLALLGERKPLREIITDRAPPTRTQRACHLLARVLSWLLIGPLVRWGCRLASRWHQGLRAGYRTTLAPTSLAALLALYHSLGQRFVVIAGHNTGVVHFGWKHPGKMVLQTTASGKRVRARGQHVDVDAGVLLKDIVTALRACGKELLVLPNYSYISAGTVFMVPVHGSGCEVSTLGDTVERVILYDPREDRIVRARRGDARFREAMYNPASGVLVLRLRFRVRGESRFFVRSSRLTAPSGSEIWFTFAKATADNVEVRKARATSDSVDVSEYFVDGQANPTALAVPRDRLGRLWDWIEGKPPLAALFHWYVRNWGFHVELFLNEREFEVFWNTHRTLPLSKIQLRWVRRDGMPHSPFGDADRISVDLFMSRRHEVEFRTVIQEQLPYARFNPGKHSM